MATAPLRKCMSVVAGTPVIDSPSAAVTTSLPSMVTRTIADFRCSPAMVSRTIFSTASACAGGGAGGAGGLGGGEQAVSSARVLTRPAARRMRDMDVEPASVGLFSTVDPMKYLEVDGVGQVSRIGLGTWQFGSREWGYGDTYAAGAARDIVARARALGVTLFDTAE